jgi:hypothetical protein
MMRAAKDGRPGVPTGMIALRFKLRHDPVRWTLSGLAAGPLYVPVRAITVPADRRVALRVSHAVCAPNLSTLTTLQHQPDVGLKE